MLRLLSASLLSIFSVTASAAVPSVNFTASSQDVHVISGPVLSWNVASSIDPAVNCGTTLQDEEGQLLLDISSLSSVCPVYTLHVPEGAEVWATLKGGAISSEASLSELHVEGDGGNVSVGGTVGAVHINNSNGPIGITGAFDSLHLQNVNGDIQLNNTSSGSTTLIEHNGKVQILSSSIGRGVINIVNGRAEIISARGAFDATLTNADIRFTKTDLSQGTKTFIKGTNSDVRMQKLGCAPRGLSTSAYGSTSLVRSFRRQVTRVRGKISVLRKIAHKGHTKRTLCSVMTVDLRNGKVRS